MKPGLVFVCMMANGGCPVIPCASDVRLDHAQQGFVPGRLHRNWQQPPPCRGAANPAQPLRHELHGKTRRLSAGGNALPPTPSIALVNVPIATALSVNLRHDV